MLQEPIQYVNILSSRESQRKRKGQLFLYGRDTKSQAPQETHIPLAGTAHYECHHFKMFITVMSCDIHYSTTLSCNFKIVWGH